MKRYVVAVALVGLTASGCGGSTKATLAGPSPTSSPTAEIPTSAASLPAGFGAGKCQEVAGEFAKASRAFSTPATDAPLSEKFTAVSTAFATAADLVPDAEVKDALKTLSTAYGELAKGLKGVNYTPGSGKTPPAAYLAAIRSIGDPKFAAAGQKLSAYFASGCK